MYDDNAAKGRTPFKGDDFLSKTARTTWDLPGSVAQSFSNVFTGKTKISNDQWLELGANAAIGGMLVAAGIQAGRSGMMARASTASLAASRVSNAATILANRRAAAIQYRRVVGYNRTARLARASTNVRAARLARVEASLRDSRPEVAERFGDRGYVMTSGREIGIEMARAETIGTGRRTLPSSGSGPRQVGAISFPNVDSPLAGSHHRYTPLSEAWPSGEVLYLGRQPRGNNDAAEWLKRTAGFSDPYGRTGVERLSGMYPGRVPVGGWSVRPNLRKRTPLPTNYPNDYNDKIIRPGEMADGFNRTRVAELLDEASSFRNRSAWRLQSDPQSRAVFPRPYDWVTEPSWAPESYQLRVFRASDKKRIGKGK
tara:strand:+ start:1983 stop:3095 length:1113 start_codon:yes stop_codon:yes gene_type:complete